MIGESNLPGGTVHDLPEDLEAALSGDAAALATWNDITPLARNEWICWVQSPKKPETRRKRHRGAAQARELAVVLALILFGLYRWWPRALLPVAGLLYLLLA